MTTHAQQTFTAGDDWTIVGSLQNDDGSPLDLTNLTDIEWSLCYLTTGNAAACVHGPGAQIIINQPPTQGLVQIIVPAAATVNLGAGAYTDALRVTISGLTATAWDGPVQVKRNWFEKC